MDFSGLFTAPSFWFDIICIVFLIILCARYIKLGFLSAVVQISGTVCSVIGAYLLASVMDSWVYETFFEKSLEGQIEKIVSESSSNGAQAISEKLIEIVPEGLQSLLQGSWLNNIATQYSEEVSVVVQEIMKNTVEPIVTQMICMILFFAFFCIFRFLVYLLVNFLKVANYVPVLGSINRVLGWVFGALGGSLDFFLLFCLLWIFILLTGDNMPFLNTTDLAQSWFFEMFQNNNPFL